MDTEILIVGGGLSGLAAAWQLRAAGLDATLLEGRDRFGGRILTADPEGAACDLGPSWFWPGQPRIAALLEHFQIPHFEQFAEGDVLFEQMDGMVIRRAQPSPMAGALRIAGGIQRLTDAIVEQIDPSHRLPEHRVTGLTLDGDGVLVEAQAPSGEVRFRAKTVAVAVPPRLAAGLDYTPALPKRALEVLATTPTWMGGHAKFFAVYETPFWRRRGLCGSAISWRGPLAEIHDVSPQRTPTQLGSLFGFVRMDAAGHAKLGRDTIIRHATDQLGHLFGDQAREPKAVHLQDWSFEPLTAAHADRVPLTRHPDYGLDPPLGPWQGKLAFISTETSFEHGGLIEGALAAGLRFAQSVIS